MPHLPWRPAPALLLALVASAFVASAASAAELRKEADRYDHILVYDGAPQAETFVYRPYTGDAIFQSYLLDADPSTGRAFAIDTPICLYMPNTTRAAVCVRGTFSKMLARGNDGDDRIDLGASPQQPSLGVPIRLEGGNGHDQLRSGDRRDTLLGGPGDDTLDAGEENDVLDGGSGNDRLDAGPGDDTVNAVDGAADFVDCGPGSDTADVDTIDTVVACETVRPTDIYILDVDADGSAKPQDCNDRHPGIHPGAHDIPDNGIDEDCDGTDAQDPDRDADGYPRPLDCDDANPAVHPGATDVPENGIDDNCDGGDTVNPDRDRDGYPRPLDCDDTNPGLHPGATDTPGNRIDEDCRDGDAPYPRLDSVVGYTVRFTGRLTRFVELVVRRARSGAVIRVSCSGRGCPFRSRTRAVRRDTTRLDLSRLLRGASLRPGARVTVRLTKRGTVGSTTRLTTRAGRPPARSELCLHPTARTPRRCGL